MEEDELDAARVEAVAERRMNNLLFETPHIDRVPHFF
jgi:hypothetical protein